MPVTDSRDFTIALSGGPPPGGNPNPQITNVIAYPPSSAAQGATFPVTVLVTNQGAVGTCWAELEDIDTGLVLSGSRQSQSLSPSSSKNFSWNVVMPNKNFNLRVQVGY